MIETVGLCEWIDGVRYYAIATVDTESEDVTLESEQDLSVYAYYNAYRLCVVEDILKATALAECECYDSILKCDVSGHWGFSDDMCYTENSESVFNELVIEFRARYYLITECEEHSYRDDNGKDSFYAPDWWWQDQYWCDCCCCYVPEWYYHGDGTCEYCYEEEDKIIEGYCESHDHDPVFFGEYEGKFCGLGVELEVDCDHSQKYQNEKVASNLCSHCGLEYNEVRFAEDGSLNNGFENIIEAHTVKDFWAKQDKWKKMLKYLSDNGYKSHDTNTCGLHVHVSRTIFGKTEEEQTTAIAKVYTFFDENWGEIVKVSRRKNFRWSDKNDIRKDDSKSNYENWKNEAKKKNGGHTVALNNSNRNTFEYRLGRGTLNSWSFFSWIDFILTISKNAKRITVKKILSNDLVSWFSGIKESTARYIYKRNAFRETMLALFPNIEWETDLVENQ